MHSHSDNADRDLRDYARAALPGYPIAEIMADLSRYVPEPHLGNDDLQRRIQYMILHIVHDERGDLERLRQLVKIAQDDYRDIYLIISLELQDMR
jgi:hypothetical protein